jgi:hypothetical protein
MPPMNNISEAPLENLLLPEIGSKEVDQHEINTTNLQIQSSSSSRNLWFLLDHKQIDTVFPATDPHTVSLAKRLWHRRGF